MEEENKKEEPEFTDFVNVGGQPETTPEQGADPELKHKKQKEDEFTPLVVEPIDEKLEGEAFDIKIKRNGEIIESVDIICKCGNKTRLIFDYHDMQ